MRRTLLTLGFGLGSVLIAASPSLPSAVHAAPTCTPTGFNGLTAAVVNPIAPVTGDVDATGCNIGVYFDSHNGIVTNANVHGANYYGVVVNGDTNQISVDVTNSQIHDIGEMPFNGTQHGVAVYYRGFGAGSASGAISGNTVYRYQKGGITTNGDGVTVSITNNTVTGLGQVDFIAQNGIQVGFGATADVRGNTVQDNFYTGTAGVGPNPGGENPPGWQYYSAGLLIYQAGKGTKHANNMYSGNQHNVAVVP